MYYISTFSVLNKPLQMPDRLPSPQQERQTFPFQTENRILQAFPLQKWDTASHVMISVLGEQSRSSHPKCSTLGVRTFGVPC